MERLLVAGNTANGFVNYFGDFIKGARTTFLKGGSGVGKSTFIREFGAYAEKLGYEIVKVPCSSDMNSLDAIKVYGLNLVMLDATSPHVFEPELYGVSGEIFDIGKFLNPEKLLPKTGILNELLETKKQAYKCLYNELNCVYKQYQNIDNIYYAYFDEDKFNRLVKEIFESLDITCADNKIKGFVDYIAGDGYHNIAAEYAGERQIVNISGRCNLTKYDVLENIASRLDKKKVRYESYYTALYPNKLFAIGLKNIFIMCSDNGEGFDTDVCFNMNRIQGDISLLLEHRHCINYNLKRAGDYYLRSRVAHTEIEKTYLPAMDFAALEMEKQKFLDNLFGKYWHNSSLC